jgi:hypothetical protein
MPERKIVCPVFNACPPAATVGLPKTALSGTIPDEGEARMIGQKPELKLMQ